MRCGYTTEPEVGWKNKQEKSSYSHTSQRVSRGHPISKSSHRLRAPSSHLLRSMEWTAILIYLNETKFFGRLFKNSWDRVDTVFDPYKNKPLLFDSHTKRCLHCLRTGTICKISMTICKINNIQGVPKCRGGVLEDVLGLEDVLEDRFWSPWPWPRRSSPWPWPRGLKSSKIGLSSARGQHFFLES